MLVVEDFLLLAVDPRGGKIAWPRSIAAAELFAAGLILDLAAHQCVRLVGTNLQLDSSLPVTHPLLAQAAKAMGAQVHSAHDCISMLARHLDHLAERVGDGLFRRDVLHRNESRSWLLRRQLTYPIRSMQARNEALASMRHAAGGPQHDYVHGLSLLLLVDICGLLPEHLHAHEHEQAVQRLIALNHIAADAHPQLRILAEVRTALLD